MLHANDRVVRLIESARSCIEDAERPRSSPTGDATAAENRIRSAKRIEADPSRVEELRPPLSAERENATRLEKKLPLLRKEQREPRQVYYLLISLDLSKVGVHREVRGERRRQRHLRVDATLPAEKTIAQSRPERVMLGGDSASERVWHQRDVAGSLQDAEAHEIALGEQMIKPLRSTQPRQSVSSFFRRMKRRTLKPNTAPAPDWNRNVRNGMRNFAIHPVVSRDTATSQMPFQFSLRISTPLNCASHIAPFGLV